MPQANLNIFACMIKNVCKLLGFSSLVSVCMAAPLEVGAKVPAVQSTDQEGKVVDLGAALAKGTSLVFFYPKASTGG